MEIAAYRDEIKLKLSGYLLDLELDDPTLDKIINSALRELQRYICSTKYITIPYKGCTKLSEVKDENGNNLKVNSVARVFRSVGYISNDGEAMTSAMDPMYASQWQMLSGTGNLYNFQDYMYNYMSWNTLLQVRNTTSTDLVFRFDKSTDNLYINLSSGNAESITVEYVPRYDSVDEIVSDYWIDVLIRLSIALTKVTLGRIRSRYTQSNALWTQDGETMLNEGNTELSELREQLRINSQLTYPID